MKGGLAEGHSPVVPVGKRKKEGDSSARLQTSGAKEKKRGGGNGEKKQRGIKNKSSRAYPEQFV